MLKVSHVMRVNVYVPKHARKKDQGKVAESDLSLVGTIRQVAFSEAGDRVVGFLIRRPDIAGMVKREDVFLALDSFDVNDIGLVATRGSESFDDAARERLGIDWDACIVWTGMDARTTDGKDLGWVSDALFSPKTGQVKEFYVGDGSVATSLVGNVVIPASMLKGYKDGYMMLDPAAATMSLDGGLAAKAGEGYARAKQGGKQAAERAGKAAGDAVEKGAYGLGRMIGKAKKSTTKKSASAAVGKQLGRTKGMFGSFMDEYRKASK